MSIRIALLLLLVAFLSAYAWKNWFVSLCGAVLLLAVVQHPDFPNAIAGIQGLNPWNFLLLNIFLSWLAHRHEEGLVWDMPRCASWMLIGYGAVVLTAAFRLILKRSAEFPVGDIISDDLVNSFKWVIPGLLLFDGCRTRKRVIGALAIVLGLYFLLAVQVIRWMPLGFVSTGSELSYRASKIIQNEIGYNRVTMSMMLAGASWAVLISATLFPRLSHRLAIIGAAGVVALGQALTGGRTGYLTWAVVGMVLCAIRWRKLLPIIPAVVLVVFVLVPGVRERMLQGFGSSGGGIVVKTDEYEITAGRNIAWPRVIEEIKKAPLIGYGKEGMTTTGVKAELLDDQNESFPHPHQAYLELILDNGLIGFLLVIPFYLFVLRRSFQLLKERSDPLLTVIGCTAFALVLALLVGSFGGQTFYPREGAVGMWAAIGIMLRVSVDWNAAQESGEPLFGEEVETDSEPDEGGRDPVPV